MKSSIPSLTLDGWIENKHMQMAKLWEYFMASEYSQSNTFLGDISSLKYILASTDPKRGLVNKLESTLGKLYGRYFDQASVSVNMEAKSDDAVYKFYIVVNCRDDEKEYSLQREIAYSKGKIENYEQSLDELYEQYALY